MNSGQISYVTLNSINSINSINKYVIIKLGQKQLLLINIKNLQGMVSILFKQTYDIWFKKFWHNSSTSLNDKKLNKQYNHIAI